VKAGLRAEGIALRWLKLDDLGPLLGKKLAQVRSGDAAARLKNTHAIESARHAPASWIIFFGIARAP
jgi:hypothetical protein